MGRFGILETGAGAADGAGNRFDRFILPHDALMKDFLHVHKPCGLILRHARDRNARPQRHDFSHLFLAHGFHAFLALQLPVAARVLHFLQQALLLVAQVGGLLKILVLYRLTGFLIQLRHALFLFLHVRRRGERADAHARRGLVDQVDRLVRQEAVADIPVGQHDRRARWLRR